MAHRRRLAVRLLVSGLTVVAFAGSAGIAGAQPDATQPVVPSIIDQLVTSTPVLSVNPDNSGGGAERWGGVGMFCQNLGVRCR